VEAAGRGDKAHEAGHPPPTQAESGTSFQTETPARSPNFTLLLSLPTLFAHTQDGAVEADSVAMMENWVSSTLSVSVNGEEWRGGGGGRPKGGGGAIEERGGAGESATKTTRRARAC